MGAIPEADPDEPVETKPFKFVTGECTKLLRDIIKRTALQKSDQLLIPC
jgi:hypothetical protein